MGLARREPTGLSQKKRPTCRAHQGPAKARPRRRFRREKAGGLLVRRAGDSGGRSRPNAYIETTGPFAAHVRADKLCAELATASKASTLSAVYSQTHRHAPHLPQTKAVFTTSTSPTSASGSTLCRCRLLSTTLQPGNARKHCINSKPDSPGLTESQSSADASTFAPRGGGGGPSD